MNGTKSVIIVGGGIAGSVMALELARSNIDVRVLESNTTFIQKPGECLPPVIRPLLKKLQLYHLLQRHQKSYGNKSLWGNSKLQEDHFIHSVNGYGTHIHRGEFEAHLSEEAKKAGATWLSGCSMTGIRRQGDQWVVSAKLKGESKEFSADFMVDASGKRAVVAKHLGFNRVWSDKLVAITALLHGEPLRDTTTLIEATPQGWWYSASLPNQQLIISYMTDGDLIQHQLAHQTDGWTQLLEQTDQTKKRFHTSQVREMTDDLLTLKVHQACSSRLEKISGTGWIAIGDAACTFDPISSYGITAAMGAAYYGSCAIKSNFRQAPESLATYHYLMDQMYGNCQQLIRATYQQEKRWASNTFWARRLNK